MWAKGERRKKVSETKEKRRRQRESQLIEKEERGRKNRVKKEREINPSTGGLFFLGENSELLLSSLLPVYLNIQYS